VTISIQRVKGAPLTKTKIKTMAAVYQRQWTWSVTGGIQGQGKRQKPVSDLPVQQIKYYKIGDFPSEPQMKIFD
jgi:hypothetical protein